MTRLTLYIFQLDPQHRNRFVCRRKRQKRRKQNEIQFWIKIQYVELIDVRSHREIRETNSIRNIVIERGRDRDRDRIRDRERERDGDRDRERERDRER